MDQEVDALLQSTSVALFPADMGRRRVTLASRDSDGDSPLHALLWRRNAAGARRLIEAGADPNAIGDMGETPLHVAVRAGFVDVVTALMACGADPEVRSEFGKTPAEMVLSHPAPIARQLKWAIRHGRV